MSKAALPVAALLLFGALAAPVIQSLGLAGTVRKMRTDFVALRCLDDAMRAAMVAPKDRTLARERIQRALALAPREPSVLASAPAILAEIGDYRAAAAALDGQPSPNPLLLGQALLKLGDDSGGLQVLADHQRRVEGDYKAQRLSEFEYAMELNNVGYTMAEAGVALDQARALLERATNILPLDPNCVDSLGWVYYRLGDYRKAAFYLERAVRLQPSPVSPELLYHLGAAYARTGQLTRARGLLLTALSRDPQSPEVLHELRSLQWLLPAPRIACTGAARPS